MMFPSIRNYFDDVAPHIEGHDEFIVIKKEGYIAVDYVYIVPDSFDHPVRMECRGLKFYDNGKIMARPLHKFFNVGEKDFTQPDQIDLKLPHLFMPKMDGSMVHGAVLNGEVVLMTRKGRTDIAIKAESLLTQQNIDGLRNLCLWWSTPIFEYTAPDNLIVVPYEKAALTLIAVRHDLTGEYESYSDIKETAENWGFQVIERHESSTGSMHTLLEAVKPMTGIEGFVIRFDDGFHVKMKTDEYARMHRARDLLSREKDIIWMVLDGGLDDFLPLVEEVDQNKLQSYAYEIGEAMVYLEKHVSEIVAGGEGHDQKTFAVDFLPIATRGDDRLRSLAFAERAGKLGAAPRMIKKMKPDEIREWLWPWPAFPNFQTALVGDDKAAYIVPVVLEYNELNPQAGE